MFGTFHFSLCFVVSHFVCCLHNIESFILNTPMHVWVGGGVEGGGGGETNKQPHKKWWVGWGFGAPNVFILKVLKFNFV